MRMADSEQELSLGDEDRLPWLEAVESEEEEPKVDTGKIFGFVVAALLALGIVVGGIWWLRSQEQTPEGARWVDARVSDDAALAKWGIASSNA